MSDALPLPPRPNPEQYKKLAKDFQLACKSSDSGAIRQRATRWAETIASNGLPTQSACAGGDSPQYAYRYNREMELR
jgi:hypothetical protein